MFINLINGFHQVVRLVQVIGIPVMVLLFLLGFVLILTSGKNPIRKRRGYIFIIVFGIGAFAVAYLPAIIHNYTVDQPLQLTAKHKTVKDYVDSATPLGTILFNALFYIAIPITGFMFYAGVIIRFMAPKNPTRRRKGIGLALFAPLTMFFIYIVPKILIYI